MYLLAIASSEPIFREVEKEFNSKSLAILSSAQARSLGGPVDSNKETADIYAALGVSPEQVQVLEDQCAGAFSASDSSTVANAQKQLSDEEAAICKSLGISETAYLESESQANQLVTAALSQRNTANAVCEDEAWVCRSLGISKESYRATREVLITG